MDKSELNSNWPHLKPRNRVTHNSSTGINRYKGTVSRIQNSICWSHQLVSCPVLSVPGNTYHRYLTYPLFDYPSPPKENPANKFNQWLSTFCLLVVSVTECVTFEYVEQRYGTINIPISHPPTTPQRIHMNIRTVWGCRLGPPPHNIGQEAWYVPNMTI